MMPRDLCCSRSNGLVLPRRLSHIAIVLTAGLLFSDPVLAAELKLRGDFTQGGMVQGQTQPGTKITLDKNKVLVAKSGHFVFGFGYDYGATSILRLTYPDGKKERRVLKVEQRTFRTQKIDGLPKKYVSPPAGVIKRIKRENRAIGRVRLTTTRKTWFADNWQWPAVGRISGVYGSRRILNGVPKRPHYGVDVAAPTGTPIVSPADGRIAMAEKDLYYTGGTVMIDHGHGITSIMSHMQSVTVKVGDMIMKGEKIGTLGGTGRATGPHLDWRVNWYRQRLDPQLIVGAMPTK